MSSGSVSINYFLVLKMHTNKIIRQCKVASRTMQLCTDNNVSDENSNTEIGCISIFVPN